MTLIRPTIQEVGAAIHMQIVRMAYSAFLDGPGLAKVTDYTVSGSAATLSLVFSAGSAFIDMPGPFSGMEPCVSDSIESRQIATAPNSGTRSDLVYIGVEDIEFGSARNFWDIYIDTNPTVGVAAPGKPADTNQKGWYILGTLDVPAKVTKGSQCVFHRTAKPTAPIRDGGFTSGDVNLAAPFYRQAHRVQVGAGGTFNVPNSCPFKPSAVYIQYESPIYFDPNILSSVVVDKSSLALGTFHAQAFNVGGGIVPSGITIGFDALYIP